jgi:Protein of unknown function (DUF1214)
MYLHADADLVAILTEASCTGQATVDVLAPERVAASVNGWLHRLHSFAYNTHRLELGTINRPEWKIPNREWANEVDGAYAFVDDRGEPLTGARRYVIHFEQTPPVDAFWALTMYDATNDSLVKNPIDRYAIGDRTPGLRYNADGSLDLYLQHASPGAEQEANWLPTPAGAFLPTLHMYQPQEAVRDGRYVLPPITRL